MTQLEPAPGALALNNGGVLEHNGTSRKRSHDALYDPDLLPSSIHSAVPVDSGHPSARTVGTTLCNLGGFGSAHRVVTSPSPRLVPSNEQSLDDIVMAVVQVPGVSTAGREPERRMERAGSKLGERTHSQQVTTSVGAAGRDDNMPGVSGRGSQLPARGPGSGRPRKPNGPLSKATWLANFAAQHFKNTSDASPSPPCPSPRAGLTARAGAASIHAPASGGADDGNGDGPTKVVLVAKVLTRSDASTRRIILPRLAVESNLTHVIGQPSFSFTATDALGKQWPFVIRSWANGVNPKPVYVLEHISDFLKAYNISEGDAVGLSINSQGGFEVDVNTDEVNSAVLRPNYSAMSQQQQVSMSAADWVAKNNKGDGSSGSPGRPRKNAGAGAGRMATASASHLSAGMSPRGSGFVPVPPPAAAPAMQAVQQNAQPMMVPGLPSAVPTWTMSTAPAPPLPPPASTPMWGHDGQVMLPPSQATNTHAGFSWNPQVLKRPRADEAL